jgi:GGDEF domain-containing protein
MVHVFDRIDPLLIERRSAQLWTLAIASIVILASGVALIMYPAAFTQPVAISGTMMRRCFFGFCVLSVLLVAYLTDRQMAIQELRRQLSAEETRVSGLLRQASVDLLGILPNFEHFQDRLSMEFRRATIGRQPLSLVAVFLTPGGSPNRTGQATVCGDAAKSIIQRLRGGDSIYYLRDRVFGVILPGASLADASRIADRLAHGLQEISGSLHSFSFELKVINYPSHASSARELENLAKGAFTDSPVLAQAA